MRAVRAFYRGEKPVCARCARPRFVVLDHFLVCDAKVGVGNTRRTCGTIHYLLQDPSGSKALLRVTQEEMEEVAASDNPLAVLHRIGIPELAQAVLHELGRAAA